MRHISEKIRMEDGTYGRRPQNMRKRLNLNYLSLVELAPLSKEGFPELECNTEILPDYLALYNHRCDYQKTAHTCVCFYIYDDMFDGLHGLYNAIYHDDKRLLNEYKRRFANVRFFISPDYSQFGDLENDENRYRIRKARFVSLWFIHVMKAVLIPNITYVFVETFPTFFSGLERCSVVAFSTKGQVRYARERRLLKATVQYAVDNLPLKTIIVYSACGKDETSLKLFQYAIEKGVKVVIPNNCLRERNRRRFQNV